MCRINTFEQHRQVCLILIDRLSLIDLDWRCFRRMLGSGDDARPCERDDLMTDDVIKLVSKVTTLKNLS